MPQQKKKKSAGRHEVQSQIDTMDYRSNDEVTILQQLLNSYQIETINQYDKKDSLRVDGMYGPKTDTRKEKFINHNRAVSSELLIDSLKAERLEHYRNSPFTVPSDTSGYKK